MKSPRLLVERVLTDGAGNTRTGPMLLAKGTEMATGRGLAGLKRG
jgi:hypothetical protein